MKVRMGAHLRRLVAVLTAQAMVGQQVVMAGGAIVPDGNTATRLVRSGDVTDVRTDTVVGRNALNSFRHFSVPGGETVNLHVPNSAANLLNLVHDSATRIEGTLNGLKNGRIGGNIYFANPHGFVVSRSGVVNVGSLHVRTPTTEYMQGFFEAPGVARGGAVAALVDGTAPIGTSGLVRIAGQVNALHAMDLQGGVVDVNGGLAAGGGATARTVAVNMDGLVSGEQLVERDGELWITAREQVALRGEARIQSDRRIEVRSGGDIHVGDNAALRTLTPGDILVWAERDASLADRAVIDAGDGGAIEFSAIRQVVLNGGHLAAGSSGSILIDPYGLTVGGNLLRGGSATSEGLSWDGANLTLQADQFITIEPDALISTRDVVIGPGQTAREAHLNNASMGDSGDLTLLARKIEVKAGAALLAHVEDGSGYQAGDIRLQAVDDAATPVFGSLEDQAASIEVSGATLRGRNIELRATADDRFDYGGDVANKVLGTLDNFSTPIDVTVSEATAEITIGQGADLTASGDIAVSAHANTDSSMYAWSTGFAAGWGEARPTATVDVGDASLSAGGDLLLSSYAKGVINTNVSAVNTGYTNPLPGNANKYIDLAIAYSHGDLRARTEVAGDAVLNVGGHALIAAQGYKDTATTANGKAYDDGTAGAAFAVSEYTTRVDALVNGRLDATNITISADLVTGNNATTASSGSGTGIIGQLQKYVDPRAWAGALAGKASQYVSSTAISTGATGTAEKFGLAASYARVDQTNEIRAGIGSQGRVEATADADVQALSVEGLTYRTSSSVDVARVNGRKTPKDVALSAAVAKVDLVNRTDAYVDDGAILDAGGDISLTAFSDIPPPIEQWGDWSDVHDFGDGVSKLFDLLGDSTFSLITGWAQSFAESERLSLAGSFNFLTIDNSANAWVGDGARINQLESNPGDLDLLARAESSTFNMAGVFGFNPLKAFTGTQSGNAGFGGAYVDTEFRGGADASIGSGAQIDAGRVAVVADTNASAVSIGESGGTAGKVSINGVYNESTLDNVTIAQVAPGVAIDATDLLVAATDDSININGAGGVGSGKSVGVGVSVSNTESRRNTQAFIGNSPDDLRREVDPDDPRVAVASDGRIDLDNNLAIQAENHGALWNVSVAGAFASTVPDSADKSGNSKGGLGIAGDVSINTVNDTTRAGVGDGVDVLANRVSATAQEGRLRLGERSLVTLDRDGADWTRQLELPEFSWSDVADPLLTFSLEPGIDISAVSDSSLQSYSGAVTIVPSASGGIGVDTAINRLGGLTEAFVSGAGTNLESEDILVNAEADSEIATVAVAVGASGKVGFAGSVVSNHLTGATTARVDGGAVLTAANNVGVLARGDDRIQSAAGSVGIGAQAAGVGASINVNDIRNTTQAYVDGAATRVNARANGASVLSVADSDLGTSVDLGRQVDLATYARLDLKGNRNTRDVHGLAVNAASSQHIEVIGANVAGSGRVAAGLVENINTVGGLTTAYVHNARINQDGNAGAASVQAVDVRAGNIAYGNGFVGNIAAGQAAAGVGEDIYSITRTTNADVTGGRVDARQALHIVAQALQGVSSLVVGGSIGGIGFAGSLGMVLAKAVTTAVLDGTPVNTGDLEVKADSNLNLHQVGGALAAGGSGLGGAFVISKSESTTRATLQNLSGAAALGASGDVDVVANNATDVRHVTVSGALAGGVGIAGMLSLHESVDVTEASVRNASLGTGAARMGSLDVQASHDLALHDVAGALGVGLSSTGIGAGASVNIVKARTTATLADSVVFSNGKVSVDADSGKRLDAWALTAGIGNTAGIGGSAAVILVGDDVRDESAGELDQGSLEAADEFAGAQSLQALEDEHSSDALLTSSERTQVNRERQTEVAATARGNDPAGYTHRTAATVTASQVDTGGAISVSAIDRVQAKSVVGGFGISLGLGLGGGVGVTQTHAQVLAGVDADSTLTAGDTVDIEAQADAIDDDASVIDILALTGAGGLVGLGAAVVIADVNNQVTAELGGITTATGQAVSLNASDNSAIDIQAYGGSIGAAAAGAVIARADKSSDVQARTLQGASTGAASLAVRASTTGGVHGKTLGAAGGVFVAGTGADTEVSDSGLVQAYTGNDNVITLDAGLVVDATTHPDVYAEARGYGGSLAVNVGVALADAALTSGAYVDLGNNTRLNAGSLLLSSRQTNSADAENVRSFAIAAGGALFGSVVASSATARNVAVAETSIGDNSDLTLGGEANVSAFSYSSQAARVNGYQGALGAARGSTQAIAEYNTRQWVDLGDGTDLSADRLRVDAGGRDVLYAESKSGQGALVASRAAAEASTQGRSDTRIRLGDGLAGSVIDTGDLIFSASHEAVFNGLVDSGNGALIGLSGADLFNDISADTRVLFGRDLDVRAESLFAHAANITSKPELEDANARSGSGGFYDGPAVRSISTLSNTAEVDVGERSRLSVDADPEDQGSLRLRADNTLDLFDKVELDSGGAIANAKGVSHLDADRNDATVNVGADAQLRASGDIELAAHTDADVRAEVYVDTYGLSGVGQGDTRARVHTDSQTRLESGSLVRAGGDLTLAAGRGAGSDSQLDAYARTKLWNKTVFPFYTDPQAHGEIEQANRVHIANDARALAVGDLGLLASNGSHTVTGDGTGTDAWREAAEAVGNFFGGLVGADEVSLDIQGGSTRDASRAGVQVDGQARAGIQHQQFLTFAADGSVAQDADGSPIHSDGVRFNERQNVSLNNTLQDRIDSLQTLADEYRPTDPDVSDAFQAEADFLSSKLTQLGGAEVNVDFFDIDDILARSGDVAVSGDYLQGSGVLDAPGDVQIRILNQSGHFLNVERLTIPESQGGHVLMNGVPVHDSTGILARNRGADAAVALTVNDAQSSPRPSIEVVSNDINASPLAGVFLNGDISNRRGEVSVYSEGDIAASANIDARSVELKAGRDVMLGYVYGFRHLGGDPVTHQPFAGFSAFPTYDYARGVAEEVLPAGSGITAGSNVFISAERLNINNEITSGRPYRTLIIDDAMTGGIGAFQASYDTQVAAGSSPDPRLALNFTPGSEADLPLEHVRAWYNAGTARIELEPLQVDGGNIVLFGDIFSTGNGRLRAVDGFGRIRIENQTPYPVELRTADTGAGTAGIEGRVQITDTARRSSINTPMTTVFSRIGDVIYNEHSYLDAGRNKIVVSSGVDSAASDGRHSLYQPLEDRRFHWINGRRTRVEQNRIYTTRVLFGIDWLVPDYDDPDETSSSTSSAQRISGDYLAGGSTTNDYEHDYSSGNTGFYKWRGDSESRNGVVCVAGACAYEDVKVTAYYRKDIWETFNHSIAADKPIAIEFTGWDQGDLSIQSSGALHLTGRVRNLTGPTLVSGDRGIVREGPDAVVIGHDVTLRSVAGSIGSQAGQAPVDVDLAGSVLNLIAMDDIVIHEQDGDLTIGHVESTAGDVDLSADLGIFAAAPAATGEAHIRGRKISLSSAYGGIGNDADTPLVVDTDADAGGTLNARAAGDVFLTERSGDVRAGRIGSLGGAVQLRIPDGNLLDGNGDEVPDLAAENALREALANELGLLDPAEVQAREDATVAAYEAGIEADYQRYWREDRQLQLDGSGLFQYAAYDPGVTFRYTPAQRSALVNAGWSDVAIAASEDQRTLRYRSFGRTDYDPAFNYNATLQERGDLVAGAGWSAGEVTRVLPRSLFVRTVADTETRIEAPNLEGHALDVDVAGAVGKDRGNVVIPVGTRTSELSDEQLLALGAAERTDVLLFDDRIEVVQKEDVDVDQLGSGGLRLRADGDVYLGSETGLDLVSLDGRNVRIKSTGGLHAAAGANVPVLNGDSIILESATGDLGSDATPLVIALRDPVGRLTARAGNNLYIDHPAADLPLEYVFAGHTARLRTGGALLDANLDTVTDIRADDIVLEANRIGDTGLPEAALDFGHGPAGRIRLDTVGDASLLSPAFDANIGSLDVGGDARITTALGDISIENPATAGGDLFMRAGGDVIGVGDILHVSADSLDIRSDNGRIGLPGQPLVGHSNTWVTLQAALGINFEHRPGDLEAPRIHSDAGTVEVTVTDGDATIGELSGGEVRVALPGEGRQLSVGRLSVSDSSVVIDADHVDLPDVRHTGDGVMDISVRGNDGGLTQTLNLNVGSSGPVRYLEMKSEQVSLAFGSGPVDLKGLLVGTYAEFSSPIHRVVVDNRRDRVHSDATAQLYAPGRAFDLSFSGERLFLTDAVLIHYDADYIANAFSTDNSLRRAVGKRLEQSRRTSTQGGGVPLWGLTPRAVEGTAPALADRLVDTAPLIEALPDEEAVELTIVE